MNGTHQIHFEDEPQGPPGNVTQSGPTRNVRDYPYSGPSLPDRSRIDSRPLRYRNLRRKLTEGLRPGRAYSADFVKRTTGERRRMRFSVPVPARFRGATRRNWDPRRYNLLNVHDLDKGEPRMINLDSVLRVRGDGEEYRRYRGSSTNLPRDEREYAKDADWKHYPFGYGPDDVPQPPAPEFRGPRGQQRLRNFLAAGGGRYASGSPVQRARQFVEDANEGQQFREANPMSRVRVSAGGYRAGQYGKPGMGARQLRSMGIQPQQQAFARDDDQDLIELASGRMVSRARLRGSDQTDKSQQRVLNGRLDVALAGKPYLDEPTSEELEWKGPDVDSDDATWQFPTTNPEDSEDTYVRRRVGRIKDFRASPLYLAGIRRPERRNRMTAGGRYVPGPHGGQQNFAREGSAEPPQVSDQLLEALRLRLQPIPTVGISPTGAAVPPAYGQSFARKPRPVEVTDDMFEGTGEMIPEWRKYKIGGGTDLYAASTPEIAAAMNTRHGLVRTAAETKRLEAEANAAKIARMRRAASQRFMRDGMQQFALRDSQQLPHLRMRSEEEESKPFQPDPNAKPWGGGGRKRQGKWGDLPGFPIRPQREPRMPQREPRIPDDPPTRSPEELSRGTRTLQEGLAGRQQLSVPRIPGASRRYFSPRPRTSARDVAKRGLRGGAGAARSAIQGLGQREAPESLSSIRNRVMGAPQESRTPSRSSESMPREAQSVADRYERSSASRPSSFPGAKRGDGQSTSRRNVSVGDGSSNKSAKALSRAEGRHTLDDLGRSVDRKAFGVGIGSGDPWGGAYDYENQRYPFEGAYDYSRPRAIPDSAQRPSAQAQPQRSLRLGGMQRGGLSLRGRRNRMKRDMVGVDRRGNIRELVRKGMRQRLGDWIGGRDNLIGARRVGGRILGKYGGRAPMRNRILSARGRQRLGFSAAPMDANPHDDQDFALDMGLFDRVARETAGAPRDMARRAWRSVDPRETSRQLAEKGYGRALRYPLAAGASLIDSTVLPGPMATQLVRRLPARRNRMGAA